MKTFFANGIKCLFLSGVILNMPLVARAQNLSAGYVYPPHSIVANASLGEWASRWWAWALTHYGSESPVRDTDGRFAGTGQGEHPPVWFLAGSYSTAKIVRQCEIPEGCPIFFPLINHYIGCDKNCHSSCQRNHDSCRQSAGQTYQVYFRLDGVPLANPQLYYEESGNCFDAPAAGLHTVFACGYWVMLRPLAPGPHVLQFGGAQRTGFSQNIEYRILVGKPQKREFFQQVNPPSQNQNGKKPAQLAVTAKGNTGSLRSGLGVEVIKQGGGLRNGIGTVPQNQGAGVQSGQKSSTGSQVGNAQSPPAGTDKKLKLP